MTRAAVASTAGSGSPITTTPACFGAPRMGPSPCIPTMPSTTPRPGRVAAQRSRMDGSRPAWRRGVLGHPYTAPGAVPKRFFMLSVAPTQWWVFILATDTKRWPSVTVRGRRREPKPVKSRARRMVRVSGDRWHRAPCRSSGRVATAVVEVGLQRRVRRSSEAGPPASEFGSSGSPTRTDAARGGKTAKKRAVIAVARKLAVLMHRLWVNGLVYDPLYLARQREPELQPAT